MADVAYRRRYGRVTEEEYLAHYGTKGMRWGVRRAEARAAAPGGGKPVSGDSKKAQKIVDQGRNSGRESLSNKQLQTMIARMNLEQQYERMRPKKPSEKVKQWVAETLFSIGKNQAQAYARDSIADALKNSKKAR